MKNKKTKYLRIKSIFDTLQGEGSCAGQPAVFVRLAGCNLWSGLEQFRERGKGDCAMWCDTQFTGGDKVSTGELEQILEAKFKNYRQPFVVFTGGEPLLQLKGDFIELWLRYLMEYRNWKIAIETNGTIANSVSALLYSRKLGHVTVSPKALKNSNNLDHIKLRYADDFKLVYPTLFDVENIKEHFGQCRNFYLQPKDEKIKNNLIPTINAAKKHGFMVSIQVHKLLGLD